MATEKSITASQLALALVLAQGQDLVPIPGTKRAAFLDEKPRRARCSVVGR